MLLISKVPLLFQTTRNLFHKELRSFFDHLKRSQGKSFSNKTKHHKQLQGYILWFLKISEQCSVQLQFFPSKRKDNGMLCLIKLLYKLHTSPSSSCQKINHFNSIRRCSMYLRIMRLSFGQFCKLKMH